MQITGVLQVIVAIGLLNVWLLRYGSNTIYRGGNAKNLKEEFATYGLPPLAYYLVGVLKIGSAVALIVGLWIPSVRLFASILVALLMLGALGMHFKINDPMKKSVPAFLMLAMSVAIAVSSSIA